MRTVPNHTEFEQSDITTVTEAFCRINIPFHVLLFSFHTNTEQSCFSVCSQSEHLAAQSKTMLWVRVIRARVLERIFRAAMANYSSATSSTEVQQ